MWPHSSTPAVCRCQDYIGWQETLETLIIIQQFSNFYIYHNTANTSSQPCSSGASPSEGLDEVKHKQFDGLISKMTNTD